MKKKVNYTILLIFILGIVGIISLNIKNTYSVSSDTFTREQLQDMVVSTALSYYYNRNYSDYEQKSMDGNSSYSWRNIAISPEMVSRINYYNVDCSSFVSMAYLWSLGWDLSDYYNIKTNDGSYINNSKFYDNGEYKYAYNSKENFQKAYMTYGKGQGTAGMSLLAKTKLSALEDGREYVNTDPTSEFVYYYSVKGTSSSNNSQASGSEQNDNSEPEISACDQSVYSETCEEQEIIKNNIINTLQPGDILVYRSYKSNDNVGHAILYVGDALNNGERGFIHSKGTDFDPVGNVIGEDSYSIRYDTWDDYFYKYIFRNFGGYYSSNFTIIRPINNFCTTINDEEECVINKNKVKSNIYREDYTTYFNNSLSRNDFRGLKVEQYSYRGSSTSNILNKYNSVNIGDEISYRVFLINELKDRDYEDLIITGLIPDGTEYVSSKMCDNNNDKCLNGIYNSETNTITWDNIDILDTMSKSLTFTYVVKVVSGTKIVNKGMSIITQNNNKLQLADMSVSVNNTINSSKQIDFFQNVIDEKIEEIENGKTYGSNFIFIKNIYSDIYGIDFSYLTLSGIKQSLFTENSNNTNIFYTRNTSYNSETSSKINDMLVPGIYGGRMFMGNDNGDRAKILLKSGVRGTLEVGDILITYNASSDVYSTWLFYGYSTNNKPIFIAYRKKDGIGNIIKYEDITSYSADTKTYDRENPTSGWELMKIMYSYDLFMILRPTRLYDINKIVDNTDLTDNVIKGVVSDMNYFEFKNSINVLDNIVVRDKNGVELSDINKVKTGDNVILTINNNKNYSYIMSVLGDVDGNGDVNVVDIVDVARTITNGTEVSKEKFFASDYDKNETINVSDIVKIARKIVGAN